MSFSQKDKITFEIDSSQSIPQCELNNNLTTFIFSISDSTKADSGNIDLFFSLLIQLPLSLWEKSSIHVGKIHSAALIKIQRFLQSIFPELIDIL